MSDILAKVLAKGKDIPVREGLKPECKAMNLRRETAHKAKFPGKLAQHNEARASGDMVTAAVVWQKFTFLYPSRGY